MTLFMYIIEVTTEHINSMSNIVLKIKLILAKPLGNLFKSSGKMSQGIGLLYGYTTMQVFSVSTWKTRIPSIIV